ncbi:hypothetical protein JST97_36730 [bacterium]|nr:hypothetical protein [bacterium]
MSKIQCLETIFDSQEKLENILENMVKQKCDLSLVSVLRIDPIPEPGVASKYTLGDRLGAWNQTRLAWSERLGQATRSGLFGIANSGTLVVVGPATNAVARALENPQPDCSPLIQFLQALGIEKSAIEERAGALLAGKLLLMVSGTEEQLAGLRLALA